MPDDFAAVVAPDVVAESKACGARIIEALAWTVSEVF